jgi:hypothetical protein
MKKVKIKKLYKGFASVRSYIIQKCIDEKKPLQITYGKETMTIPFENLHKFCQLNKQTFDSVYSNIKYSLYDYYFKEDKEIK